jgi:hypothetical protein
MGVGPIRMGVRDLDGAGHDHQQDAQQRQENSPGTCATDAAVDRTHTTQLYRRAVTACTARTGWKRKMLDWY